ncbi:MAG: type IX secretion system sortase PorU [Bacteroidota bacterium]
MLALSLWIALFSGAVGAGVPPVQAQVAFAPQLGSASQPEQTPALRVVEQTDQRIVYEVRVDWPEPLADAVRASDDLASARLRAARGDGSVSAFLSLPSLAQPAVEVLAADYDEVTYAAPSDDAALDGLVGPVAEVTALGMERRRPAGTFVARLLRYDPERGTLRRYRRIRAAVRFPAARSARPFAAASRLSPVDNPHLNVGQSALASGTWIKVPVTQEGIYRIDRALLSEAGLSPDAIDPNNVAVFGNGGAPVPALNSAARIADLAENASFVVGGGDGRFDSGDGVYFYGAAPNGWRWNQTAADRDGLGWEHWINLFSNENAYFIRVDGGGQRVGNPGFAGLAGATVLSQITGRTFEERDLPDGMIDRDGGGSGLDWLGAEVASARPSTVVLDTLPAGIAAGTVAYRTRVATSSRSSSLVFQSGGQELGTITANSIGLLAGSRTRTFEQVVAEGARLRLEMRLGASSTQGWIDYVEAFYPKALRAERDYLRFHTPGGQAGVFEFVLAGFSAEPQVWDVTDPEAVRRLGVRSDGGSYRVQVEATDSERPRELVAFTTASAAVRTLASPEAVPNQNLHAVGGFPDYVIVAPTAFREAADEIAAYRAQDGLRPLVVDVAQIYNEFSGGLQDMRAMRDYFRFLYDRAETDEQLLRYVLLLGDGHFDFRGIRPGGDQNNWVLTYQTENSFDRIRSYTSDDYFGLLDAEEGLWSSTSERLDIGIGRFPVRTATAAMQMVEKVKRYEDPATRGAWRTRVTFVADDQEPNDWDDDLHVQNGELLADTVNAVAPDLNVQKIYAMTYPRVQTALGARYPEAQADIRRSFDEGTLVWNYSGHGGSGALADEKLLTKEEIIELDNADRLPIAVTATCSFGRYDVISDQSGGEELLLNAGGGAAAVLTTTRLVFTGSDPNNNNLGLNRVLLEFMLSREEDGTPRRLGDVYRLTKRTNPGATVNSRKFVFLGDPAMRVQLPERPISVTTVNGQPVGERGPRDTVAPSAAPAGAPTLATAGDAAPATLARGGLPELRALEEAEVTGEVLGFDGTRDTGYNGEVEVAVFDAERTVALPEDAVNYIPSGTVQVRSDLIYRGRATVRDGAWTIRFVVPRDISYSDAPGRISVYATDGSGRDGFGASEGFVVGGTAANPIQDNEPPRVDLFMNDTTFVPGGLVGTTPVLIAKLFDQNGINTVGAGVGHDLLLTIDGAEQDAVDIGRFYRGDLDSFQSGTVEFELPEQAPGPHTLTLRAWDVANNSATVSLDYFVEADGELVLRNVYNYPNPTNGPTRFVFEHNQPPGTVARIQLRIYTLSGRPVRTLDAQETLATGVLSGSVVQIPWDGRDEDFDTLATGIYLYRVRVEVERPDGETQVSERIERLAVIR